MPVYSDVVGNSWRTPAISDVVGVSWNTYDEVTVLLSNPSATVDENTGEAILEVESNIASGTIYVAWYAGSQTAKTPADIVAGTGAIDFTNAPADFSNQFTVPFQSWDADYFAAFTQEIPDVGFSQVFYTSVQDWTFTRTSEATVVDFEDNIKELPNDAAAHPGARVVRNLASGVTTQTVTVISGNEYVVTIKGDNAATAVLSNAATDTLTADGTNRITHDNGTPVTAASTSLVITVTGTLTQLQVEDVSGQDNQNPSEFVTDVQSFAYENGSQVDANGVVTELAGAAITGLEGVLLEGSRTNILLHSKDILAGVGYWGGGNGATIEVHSSIKGPFGWDAFHISGSGAWYFKEVSSASTGDIKSVFARTVSGTGSIGLLSHNSSAQSLHALTEEWQRFSIIIDTAINYDNFIYLMDSRIGTLSEVLVALPQFELGAAFPSSYIPTAGEPVTRAATSQVRTLASMGLADITSEATITLTTRLQFDSAITGYNKLLTVGTVTNGLQIFVNGTTVGVKKYVASAEVSSTTATYAYTEGELLTIVVTHAGTGTTIDCNGSTGSQANGDALAVAATTVTLEAAFQVVQGVDIV